MNTCDTCKWWSVYGSHTAPRYPRNLSLCWHHNIGPIDGTLTQLDDYLSTTQFGVRAVTGPKFGCIHHEPK